MKGNSCKTRVAKNPWSSTQAEKKQERALLGRQREHCPASILILDICPLNLQRIQPAVSHWWLIGYLSSHRSKHSGAPWPPTPQPETILQTHLVGGGQALGHVIPHGKSQATLCDDISVAQAAPHQTISTSMKAPSHTFYNVTLPPLFPFPSFLYQRWLNNCTIDFFITYRLQAVNYINSYRASMC